MSIKGTLTKELNESVTNTLGSNVKLSLKCVVKLEVKPDKTENRVLAFSACRLFILTAKVPTKVEQTFHYLDINSIESRRPNQLTIGVSDDKSYTFYSVDANNGDEINLMIIQLGTAIKTIFPQVPIESVFRKIDVEPPTRLKPMVEYNEAVECRAHENSIEAPCGGFSTQYACFCDYFGIPYREEVSWDVDSIYFTHNNTELSLLDFEHLDNKDLVPIIAALSYNGWFLKFRASNIRIFASSSHGSVDVATEVVNLVRRSTILEEIFLENTGIRSEFVNKLFMGLLSNSNSALHTIDLSHNFIEDKGLKSLCGFIAKVCKSENSPIKCSNKLNKGLVSLNLAHTSITSKGVSEIADAFSLNKSISSSLTYLNLSGNSLKDDVNKLYNFLAQPNCLVHLDLSSTECCLDTIFGALLRGSTQKLSHLDLSKNQFTSKKSHKEVNVPPSFKAFFSSTVGLKTLNLSSNKLPAEALKAMLLGFACNEIATDVRLDLSSNDLKSNGAIVFELCIVGTRCISGLDLRDNSFDADVANIINAISKNKSIKYLSIGKNYNNIKPKHLGRVLNSFVQLLQDEDCSLESLSISDSKLKNETCLVINALGSNHSLVNIDVSGNQMGLSGAKTLAKALQVNSKLETIFLDRNLIPTAGFIDIAYSLERNFTLRHMPIPAQDLQAAMIKTPERAETAISKIQELLRRNNMPHSLLKSSRFHVHHLQFDNTTYYAVDKLIVLLQDMLTSRAASNNNDELMNNEENVKKAEAALKDALNAKQLLNRLNKQFIFKNENSETGRRFSSSFVCKPIESQLLKFSNELKNTTEAYINNTVSGMLQYVQELCPNLFINNDRLEVDFQRLVNNLPATNNFPSLSFFQDCLMENTSSHLMTKIEDILQHVAVQICDKILAEVCECLSACCKAMTGSEQKIATNYQRSSTPDVLRNRVWGEGSCSRDSSNEGYLSTSQDGDTSATPKQPNQKRQSLYARKLRPQSVLEGLNSDTPDLLKTENLLSSDSNEASLVTAKSNEALEHLGKSRPKKPKTRAPTRTAIASKASVGTDNKELDKTSSSEKLDEGLDSFFKRSANETQKPVAQPRSLLKKPIIKTNDQVSKPLDEKVQSSDEVIRSNSSPNIGKRQFRAQRTSSPGTEEINSILERVERVSSPVPPEHSELLAEMRAKQEKRSLSSTPTTSVPGTEESPPLEIPTTSSGPFQVIKLRASAFGDVMKSPSKIFSSSSAEDSSLDFSKSSTAKSLEKPPIKQRPKSVVGILGAKFELSASKGEGIDIDKSSESLRSDVSSKSESETRSVKKTIGVFNRTRNSSYSLPK